LETSRLFLHVRESVSSPASRNAQSDLPTRACDVDRSLGERSLINQCGRQDSLPIPLPIDLDRLWAPSRRESAASNQTITNGCFSNRVPGSSFPGQRAIVGNANATFVRALPFPLEARLLFPGRSSVAGNRRGVLGGRYLCCGASVITAVKTISVFSFWPALSIASTIRPTAASRLKRIHREFT